jgi:glycosyltransferase involved in cell wall biosynthesis
MSQKPTISIVLEGFNESRERGASDNTIGALRRQDFPLHEVELILVGSSHQVEEWSALCQDPRPFGAVKALAADGATYYALKNMGAEAAEGEIIAFTDSDVYPASTWISSIVQNIRGGADVSVGLSLFQDADGWTSKSIFRQMAVSCTFGYILGPQSKDGVEVRGFMDHNVALKANILGNQKYRTDFGRVLASPLLFRDLQRQGHRIRLTGGQAVVHHFGWIYWVHKLNFRYGYEVYRLRRLDPHYPNPWIRKTWIAEPLVTMAWHMLLDVPRWLRFCKVRGIVRPAAWLLFPCLIAISSVARTTEMLGMYATMLWPESMARWSESV